VKKTKPLSSYSLSRTVRADGRPDAAAVATTMALGSGMPDAMASVNQAANWPVQSAARSASSSATRSV
jgi:hypothetical protein